jgi:hypothetical protein
MTSTALQARRVLDSVDPASGWHPVRVGVGQTGDIVRALSDERPRWLEPGWPSPGEPPQRVTLRVERGAHVTDIEDFVLGRGICVQPLGTEDFLVVYARAAHGEANARVFGSDGSVRYVFHAGDGIQDVQVSRRGDVWVSYFDEGVFGGGALGCEGLVRLDAAGAVTMRYGEVIVPRGVAGIVDCYALNVATDLDTWLYYYDEFPIVHLHDGALSEWWPACPVRGASALAVHRGRVLFAGEYHQRQRMQVLTLADMSVQEVHVIDDAGAPMTFVEAVGRGSRMYFVQGDGSVHVAALDQLQRIS